MKLFLDDNAVIPAGTGCMVAFRECRSFLEVYPGGVTAWSCRFSLVMDNLVFVVAVRW